MRLTLVLLPMALAAAPAAAQMSLAQQCAGFGQAHYRELDPTVDRISVSELPPPALERFTGKVGQQPFAAVLTIKGQISYRGRPAIEGQFICLLDAADRPLFFHALPPLASRTAPTPLVRAPSPPVQREAAVPPPRPVVPRTDSAAVPTVRPGVAAAVRLRGLVRETAERLQLTPCDGGPLGLEDRTPERELSRTLQELTGGQQGRPIFVELLGHREGGIGTSVAALELRRAAVDTPGCRERFDHREWLASGSDPVWRLEVTAREMVLNLVGVTAPPLPRIAHDGAVRAASDIVYAGSDGSDFRVSIVERRCVDPQSGALFAYAVEVQSEGRSLSGCAAHNPAMPAP